MLNPYQLDPLLLEAYELDFWEFEGPGDGSLAGTVSLSLSLSATLTGDGAIAGTIPLSLAVSGGLVCLLSGTVAMSLHLGTPWRPTDLPGIAGWWSTKDTRNTHVGGQFTTLFDLSGGGHTATAVGTVLRAASLNGQIAAATDGNTTDEFSVTGLLDVFRNKSGAALAAVYDITDQASPAITYLMFGPTSTSSSTRFSLVAGNGTTANAPGLRSKRLDADSTTALSSPTAHAGPTVLLGAIDWANNDALIEVDGTQEAASTSHGTAGTTSDTAGGSNFRLLGTTSGNADTFDGVAGEWVVANAFPSLADRQRLAGYLAHEWQLAANLPSDHPYKTVPPMQSAAVLTGVGALAGTIGLSLGASATLTGAGALSGTAALSLTPSATLSGAGTLAGSTTLALTASGELQGLVPLSGTCALSLTASGALTGSGALVGSAALALTPSADLTGAGALAGAIGLSLAPTATLTGLGALSGTIPLTLAAAGDLQPEESTGALSGTIGLSLSASATLAGAGALAGTAPMATTATATLQGAGALAGSTGLALTPSATLSGLGALAGSIPLALTTSASGTLIGTLAGTAALTLTGSGTLTATGALAGTIPIILTLSGGLLSPALPTATTVARPDSWADGTEVPRQTEDAHVVDRLQAANDPVSRPAAVVAAAVRTAPLPQTVPRP